MSEIWKGTNIGHSLKSTLWLWAFLLKQGAAVCLMAAILASGTVAQGQDETTDVQIETTKIQAAHASFMADDTIQHEFPDVILRDTDTLDLGWLEAIFQFIADVINVFGGLLQVLFWLGLVLIVGLILFVILKESDWLLRLTGKKKETTINPGYVPEESYARNLLDEADALAEQGKYAEAARLLLQRSIEDISDRRDIRFKNSLTSREIASHDQLPENARPAFSRIAQIVENAFFAGKMLNREGYGEARKAYAAFALPESWA